MCSFSFPFQFFPNVGGVCEPLFNEISVWVGSNIFGIEKESLLYHSGEDSIGMLVNLVNVCFISLLLYGILWNFFKTKVPLTFPFAVIFLRYFLAIILLIYGFDKIYKYQFYYPEPNILYTKLKDIPQDLLYWSTMGTSYSYSVFAGLMEVIPAILLLWRRTYVLGAFINVLVFTNVVMTNFGFDVTIKLFSSFLLFCSIVLFAPFGLNIWKAFTGKGEPYVLESNTLYKSKPLYYSLKVIVVILILIECQFKYVMQGSFNDDRINRPSLHGTYEIVSEDSLWERIYFHRQGYFIIELNNGEFYDMKMTNIKDQNKLILTTYDNEIQELLYKWNADTLNLFNEDRSIDVKSIQVYKY